MQVAVWLTPFVNNLATSIGGMPVMFGVKDIYPGSTYCNVHSPHSLWHQQTGNGFFDFVMMSDFIYGLITSE